MPKKTGAGGKPQSYNPKTGKYGNGSTQLSKRAEETEKSIKEFAGLNAEETKRRILDGDKGNFRAKRNSFQARLENKPDGTYDYDTGNAVSFEGQKKWQVSFQTTDTEDKSSLGYLTDDEYDALVNEISKQTGSKPYLGKFEVPETSFVCDTMQQALDIAKKYNQMSVWDWETMSEIANPYFDPTKNTVK